MIFYKDNFDNQPVFGSDLLFEMDSLEEDTLSTRRKFHSDRFNTKLLFDES